MGNLVGISEIFREPLYDWQRLLIEVFKKIYREMEILEDIEYQYNSSAKEKFMSPQVHFDPTEATSFELVSPGTYPLRIDEVESKVSKEGKEPMLLVWFRFVDKELDKKAGRIPRNFMLVGKGAGFTVDLWKKATGEKITKETELDTDDLVGKELTCEITNETWEGTPRNKVEKVIG